LDRLVDSIKLMSFSWLKATNSTYAFSYHDWWWHPLPYMGVLV